MIATRLSSVWQVAAVAGAALVCYLVSQSVATERAALARVDRQIAQAHAEIEKLNTEIGTRSRAGQLERWNMDVLALKAPRPTQFVADGVQLVSLYAHGGQRPALPLDPAIVASHGAVTTVAYAPPAPAAAPAPSEHKAAPSPAPLPEVAPAQPLRRTATYVRPKTSRLAEDGDLPVQRTAFHPHVASLLPADIAQIAAEEHAERKDPVKKAGR